MAWHGMTGDAPEVEDLVDHPDEERRPGAHAALIAVPENVEQVSDVTMVVPKPLQQQDAAADFTDNAQDAWKKCKALEDACVDLLRHDLCLEAVRNLRQLRAHFYKRAKRDSTWRSMEELWCEQSKGSLEWKLRALRGTYLSREGRTEMEKEVKNLREELVYFGGSLQDGETTEDTTPMQDSSTSQTPTSEQNVHPGGPITNPYHVAQAENGPSLVTNAAWSSRSKTLPQGTSSRT